MIISNKEIKNNMYVIIIYQLLKGEKLPYICNGYCSKFFSVPPLIDSGEA
jgi:hypothetical protein